MAGHHGQGPLAFDIHLTFAHLTYQPGRPGFCGLARSTRMPVAHRYATGTIDHRSQLLAAQLRLIFGKGHRSPATGRTGEDQLHLGQQHNPLACLPLLEGSKPLGLAELHHLRHAALVEQ